MAFKRETEVNMDQLAAFLKNAVEKVKTEENPDLLNDVKKVFKKNVPFSLRMYVAAYLAKQCASHYRPRREFNNDYRNHESRDYRKENSKSSFRQENYRQEKSVDSENTEVRVPHPRVQIDESVATTIFVGIGRNRRVFPRDLVGLLISVGGLDRDRIGDIRVLANYSFVQLFAEDADKAINALNGYDYRGRKLSVSYSRQKIDGEDLNSSSEENISSANDFESAEDEKAYAAAERASQNVEGFSSNSLNTNSANFNSNENSMNNNFVDEMQNSSNAENTYLV